MSTAQIPLDSITLLSGSHLRPELGFCVMEAVSYFAGKPWSDHPDCTCATLGSFLRGWNDNANESTRQTLKRCVLRVIGTNDGKTAERSWVLIDWAIREHLPLFLDAIDDSRARGCAADLRSLHQINAETASVELARAIPFLNSARGRALDRARARDLDRALSLALDESRHAVMERMLSV